MAGLVGIKPDINLNTRITQHFVPSARYTRIRVSQCADNARHPGFNKTGCTGRRFANMAAGFKGDIGGGPTGPITGDIKGNAFGMRATARLRVTAPDDDPIGRNKDTANRRVRPDISQTAF